MAAPSPVQKYYDRCSTGSTSFKDPNISFPKDADELTKKHLTEVALDVISHLDTPGYTELQVGTKKRRFVVINEEVAFINRPSDMELPVAEGKNFRSIPWFKAEWKGSGCEISRVDLLKLRKERRGSPLTKERVNDRMNKELYHDRLLPTPTPIERKGKTPDLVYEHSVDGFIYLEGKQYEAIKDPVQRAVACFQIIKDIAEGLYELNQRGFYHRDIKPENILLSENHRARLIDLDDRCPLASIPQKLMGTKLYWGPETKEYGLQLPVSDYYALGKVATEFYVRMIQDTSLRAICDSKFKAILRKLISVDLIVRPTPDKVMIAMDELKELVKTGK
ncbi:MAG: hypothetical protein SP1CHLAM54_14560 [Chlamydiia bacterium]|nr:hypothetical protein [Chlamydiia bacterium]MCH9616347.1 hypothetical protein [Chlamydiia bacterium]MCH9629667.1 hypothetical protein [Chlamydiia bacterium]